MLENDLLKKFDVVPIDKLPIMLLSFIENLMSKLYFLRLAYTMITPRHITFQTNTLAILFLIIFSFVNVQEWKHLKGITYCLSCMESLNCIISFLKQDFSLHLSSQCTANPIIKVLSKLFKEIFNQISNFHQKSNFYKNYNRFWIVRN